MTPMGLYEQLALHCTKMGQVPHEGEHRFGTVANQYRPGGTPVYAPKPTNLAAKALTSTLARFRFEKRLDLQNQEEYALVFRKQGQHRIAVWTTSATQHVVKIPSAAGEFDVVTHTGEKQMPVTNAIGTAIDVMVSDCLQYGR